MLHIFATYSAPYFDMKYETEVSITRFSGAVLMLLIVIPFIVSRIVLFIKPLLNLIEKYNRYIGPMSIFVILFYLFGLQSSQRLVDIYDFEPELFAVALVAVAAFYLVTTLLAKWVYDLNSPQERAAFWHSITRYITLGLVISTFSSATFGVSMLLPIMFAYIIQIPLSVYVNKKLMVSKID
jgi:predicted Na+-dependent transporter